MTRLGSIVVLAAAAAVSLTSCSAGSPNSPAPNASNTSGVAVRWWSDGGKGAGSTIDPKNPTAAAKSLHPSRSVYCGMLRQTVSAGHSILPGATANSPLLLTSTEAFVAELQSVAPAEVSAAWKVLGTTVLALVTSGGKSGTASSAADISSAVATVATDAKTRCGVNLGAS